MYEYDAQFQEYTLAMSERSAKVVIPILYDALTPTSVLDLGCGRGAWLRVWNESGARDVVGVDGDYVAPADLVVDPDVFVARDLGRRIDLGRRFDLVESLEVAEHLPEDRARGFVDDLCRHGSIVLFSAAPPGQGGEQHINEQPYEYWRALFAEQGYEPFDFVRPRIESSLEVAPWYRYNVLLYAHRSAIGQLPADVRDSHVADGDPIPDVSPFLYKARKHIIRQLPAWATQALANVAKRMPR